MSLFSANPLLGLSGLYGSQGVTVGAFANHGQGGPRPRYNKFAPAAPNLPTKDAVATLAAYPKKEEDSKAELMQFAQKFTRRPITKEDVHYTSFKVRTGGYQCTVKLRFMESAEFVGQVGTTMKDAEKNAAKGAMDECLPIQEQLPPPEPKRQLTKMEKEAKRIKTGDDKEDANNPAMTYKTKLNAVLMKMAGRPLKKEDTTYTAMQVAGGFQATVSLKSLPGDWSTRAWAGHVATTKQKAEQSVAEIAYNQIMADAELSELATAEKPKPVKGKGKGKGKGKNKWWDWSWNEPAAITDGPAEGVDSTLKELLTSSSSASTDGVSSVTITIGEVKPVGKLQPRQKFVEEEITGEVLEWKSSPSAWVKPNGWIQPHSELDEPVTNKRGGKVYITQADLKGDLKELSVGSMVSFHVFKAMNGGLSAMNVQQL